MPYTALHAAAQAGLSVNRLYERRFEVLKSLFRCGLQPNTITVFTFASSFILSVSGTLKDPAQRERRTAASIDLSPPQLVAQPAVCCVCLAIILLLAVLITAGSVTFSRARLFKP